MFQYIPSDLVDLSWPYSVNDFANIRDFFLQWKLQDNQRFYYFKKTIGICDVWE